MFYSDVARKPILIKQADHVFAHIVFELSVAAFMLVGKVLRNNKNNKVYKLQGR